MGDTIVLTLRNNAPFAVNAEPGGLDFTTPVTLNPGDTVTYRCAALHGRPHAAGALGTMPAAAARGRMHTACCVDTARVWQQH